MDKELMIVTLTTQKTYLLNLRKNYFDNHPHMSTEHMEVISKFIDSSIDTLNYRIEDIKRLDI
mgnify:CR=1 FL=1